MPPEAQPSCLTLLQQSSPGGKSTSGTIGSTSAGPSIIVYEVRGIGEWQWINLATASYTVEHGQNVAAMCAGLPMTMVKWFCRSSALCGLSLVSATTSHSMPNGVLCGSSKGESCSDAGQATNSKYDGLALQPTPSASSVVTAERHGPIATVTSFVPHSTLMYSTLHR